MEDKKGSKQQFADLLNEGKTIYVFLEEHQFARDESYLYPYANIHNEPKSINDKSNNIREYNQGKTIHFSDFNKVYCDNDFYLMHYLLTSLGIEDLSTIPHNILSIDNLLNNILTNSAFKISKSEDGTYITDIVHEKGEIQPLKNKGSSKSLADSMMQAMLQYNARHFFGLLTAIQDNLLEYNPEIDLVQ